MKVLIDGKEYNLSPDSSGLVKITFTKQTKDAIEIGELEDCSGTTLIHEIQIEQGNQATTYEDPNLILGEATGLISEIRGIEYAISDPKTGLRSQITMLAQGFEQEVNDTIGNYSVQGQTVDGLFAEISKVNGNVNRIIQNADGTSQLITDLNNDYQSIKSTANLYERIIGSTGDEINQNISRIIQTSDVIQTEVAKMDLATNATLTSKISQLADNINLKVSSDDLLSQINLQAGGVLITSGTNKLNITPETTYIQNATINSAMIASLEADKITTGTLDAAKVRVINIDADNITANKTNFIQSNWNNITSSVRIDGGGLLSTASDGSQVYLQNGIVGARNPSGATIGQIGYAYQTESPWYSMQVSYGSHFQIRMNRGAGELNKQAFYIISGGTESYLNTDNIYLNPSSAGRVRVQGAMTVDKDLRVEGTVLVRSKLEYLNGGFIESQEANSNMLIASTNKLIMYSNGTQALEIDSSHAVFRRQVSENSDIRLKTNIEDMPIDSLNAIANIEFKKFDYLDGRLNNYGIIAQQAQEYLPELIDTDSQGYLMVNKSAMDYVNMHAIQQLNKKVDDEVDQLKARIASLQDELIQLKGV
ncbi:gp58-like family protein [Jeotgalibaca porci]|uniref:gp58-like family protein n=1 Tax=Jeotgalibaca porci TaxID=1868793 RepID=UPI00359F759F